jgi:hypothetical protein
LDLEVVTMRVVPQGDERSVHRRGSQLPSRVVLALVLVGWVILADGGSADAHSTAGEAQPATVSYTTIVSASTSARFAQGIQLTYAKGGVDDATMHVTVTATVDEEYEAVPPTFEDGGVKLVTWEPTITVTGSLDSSCHPSPDPQMPGPCAIGYFGPGYQRFTCVAAAVDLSQFPSPVTNPLRADFPLAVAYQTYPSVQLVAVVGGGTLPYTDLFKWEGGPDCKMLDNNEDGGKLLAEHSLGAVPFGCSRTDEEVKEARSGTKEYPPCSNTATQHVANDGLGDSGSRTNDWTMSLSVRDVNYGNAK